MEAGTVHATKDDQACRDCHTARQVNTVIGRKKHASCLPGTFILQKLQTTQQKQRDESKESQKPEPACLDVIVILNDQQTNRSREDGAEIILIAHQGKSRPGADDPKRNGHDCDKKERIIYRAARQKIRRGIE